MTRRVGIFGGTFDPVHNGHLQIAASAMTELALDRILFIPNLQSPLKSARPSAPYSDRLAMLQLAVAGQAGYVVSEIEGRRGGISYMVDTLREIRDTNHDAELYLIVGADTLTEFHRWREYEEILAAAQLAYVDRPGSAPPTTDYHARRITMLPNDISSSNVRQRVREGLPVDHLVPVEVARYIADHSLYCA